MGLDEEMSNIFFRILLFLSSYFPLSLIFFFIFFNKSHFLSFSILSLGLLGVLGLWFYLLYVQRLSPTTIVIKNFVKKDSEAMSYIATYIIPFLALPSDGWEKMAALFVFFLVLGILYVNSNMIHINPMLNLTKFHLYEIECAKGERFALISRKRLSVDLQMDVIRKGDEILMEKK